MNDLRPVAAHQLADEIGSLFSRDQLTQDRAYGGLETIPTTRQSQAREAIK